MCYMCYVYVCLVCVYANRAQPVPHKPTRDRTVCTRNLRGGPMLGPAHLTLANTKPRWVFEFMLFTKTQTHNNHPISLSFLSLSLT
ncbi:hypothetical protein HanIR_Chr13g0621301 [Helianthus annuus]|nr:hypothetical protein HanIR_Chr13g0621301 [Helianthus annuus]